MQFFGEDHPVHAICCCLTLKMSSTRGEVLVVGRSRYSEGLRATLEGDSCEALALCRPVVLAPKSAGSLSKPSTEHVFSLISREYSERNARGAPRKKLRPTDMTGQTSSHS